MRFQIRKGNERPISRRSSATTARGRKEMKMFAITAAEVEAMIKVEMEDICEWPTHMTVSVQPDRDTRKVVIMQDSSVLIPADTI
jgi:hypothetical protein